MKEKKEKVIRFRIDSSGEAQIKFLSQKFHGMTRSQVIRESLRRYAMGRGYKEIIKDGKEIDPATKC